MSGKSPRRLVPLIAALALVALGLPPSLSAQTTGGNLQGRVLHDASSVPGVTVTATNLATGVTRTTTTADNGDYRFAVLPPGDYSVTFTLEGFSELKIGEATINVGTTTTVDANLQVAAVEESITVTAEAPLIATEPSIGTVVSQTELEQLPLNGRQFANVAVLAPGTSLSYNSDPTKPGQLTVLLNGGNGRNVNFTVDGGDNTDDTIGGQLQNFNLDAVQEFNIKTSQYKAEYGRTSGGVLSVVTKTGTNDFAVDVYEYYRDDSLTSRTETERDSGADKQEYSRDQYGGSIGGPIVRNRAHFFATYGKLEEDKSYTINTGGLYPDLDGTSQPTPFEDELITAKVTFDINETQMLMVRYGYQKNSQKYGASPIATPDSLGTIGNDYESILGGHTATIGSRAVNEFFFQYSNFDNLISADSDNPTIYYPSGVKSGQNVNTPQTTFQTKYQYKDDFSYTTELGGDRHDWKVGANYIDEPDLGGTFTTGLNGRFNLLTNNPNGPVKEITQFGGFAGFSTPVKQYGGYIQDDWYVNDRWTLYLGVRYDYWDGFDLDQRSNPIWQTLATQTQFTEPYLQDFQGGHGGVLDNDGDNYAPRIGFSWDIKGDATQILRGGYGTFYDFPYTNATILFPSQAVQSNYGVFYHLLDNNGIRNPDGSFFRIGQPLPPGENLGADAPNEVGSPTLATPYSDQISLGYSWQVNPWLGFNIEGITIDYHDLPFRFRFNGRLDSAGNALAGPRFPQFGPVRMWYGGGRGSYDGGNLGVHIRKPRWELQGFYTYSETEGNTLAGADEFRVTDRITQPDYHSARSDGLQDFRDPFCDACFGPYYTDSRHRVNVASVWRGPWGINLSGFLRYKSALPYTVLNSAGPGGAPLDLNQDGFSNDLAPGVDHVNSERGDEFSQFDIGASKEFNIGDFGIEVIAQLFNVFDEKNPAIFNRFGDPASFAGDALQGEQQMLQLGLKLSWK
jgi:hypothetical protein